MPLDHTYALPTLTNPWPASSITQQSLVMASIRAGAKYGKQLPVLPIVEQRQGMLWASIIGQVASITSITCKNYHIPERYEERAAILEFDAGISRIEAESQAKNEVMLSLVRITYPEIEAMISNLIVTCKAF